MSVSKIFGVAGSALLAVGSLLAFPVAANAAALSVTIDCSVNEDVDIFMRSGDTLTITTVNCDLGITDYEIDDSSLYSLDLETVTSDLTGGSTLVVSSPDEPGVGINDWIGFESAEDYYIDVDIDLYPDVADPSGVLITTGDATIDGSNPAVLDFSEIDMPYDFDPEMGEHFVGGNTDECDVVAGMHEYGILEFHVTEAGEYTFRIVDVNPADPDVDDSASTSYPTDDPYLALYSDFDSNNPDDNVVGCNDDRDFRSYNSDDVLLDRQWSEFATDLEPGNYTLVYTSWGTFDDWADETEGLDQTVTFEFWGPEGGLELGALADTGTNAVTPLNALGFMLILAGAGLLIARRVRTN
ncbi:MAG: hypothetical protein RLZZ587_1044 [Actinomycetota bacterium]|jgi:hypothetical protein